MTEHPPSLRLFFFLVLQCNTRRRAFQRQRRFAYVDRQSTTTYSSTTNGSLNNHNGLTPGQLTLRLRVMRGCGLVLVALASRTRRKHVDHTLARHACHNHPHRPNPDDTPSVTAPAF
ncbi:hypothetical protein FB45DRAFT_317589 [Roridomyces roridus]|uniref:Uncharacterized protein n=1 Tax=Roridomyces roridus TaxID=1738132 RepID=A0AAD7B6V5_9AGAR|nr:hypothetical protein FB45DRAFT_317589 [Roridomyces roridus]